MYWDNKKLILFIVILFCFSFVFSQDKVKVLSPLNENEIPKLENITDVHKPEDSKGEKIAFIFETDGGDPAINGNFLYFMYLNPNKIPPYENEREIYFLKEIYLLKNVEFVDDVIKLDVNFHNSLITEYGSPIITDAILEINLKNEQIFLKERIIK